LHLVNGNHKCLAEAGARMLESELNEITRSRYVTAELHSALRLNQRHWASTTAMSPVACGAEIPIGLGVLT